MEKRQNTYYFSCGKCFRKLDGKEFKKKTFCKKVFSYATKQMLLEYQDLYCNFKDQLVQKLKSCMYFPVISDESCNIVTLPN